MEAIFIVLFVLTLAVSGLNMIKIISVMSGHTISLPGLLSSSKTKPDLWYIFYPCLLYQVWFWSDYFGLFV